MQGPEPVPAHIYDIYVGVTGSGFRKLLNKSKDLNNIKSCTLATTKKHIQSQRHQLNILIPSLHCLLILRFQECLKLHRVIGVEKRLVVQSVDHNSPNLHHGLK